MSEDIETPWAGKFVAVHRQGRWEYASRVRGIEAAALLAIDRDAGGVRHVILVEQTRVPLGARCLELPAGLVGDETAGEAIEDAAARELEEETGYRAERIENCGRFCASPGMLSETFTLLRATGLTKVGDGGGTEHEDITVHRVPITEAAAFIADRRAAGCAIDVKLLVLLGSALTGSAG